jgi:hypothetical protein
MVMERLTDDTGDNNGAKESNTINTERKGIRVITSQANMYTIGAPAESKSRAASLSIVISGQT